MGFTFKEVSRLTITSFNKFYKHYKNDFDLEMRLKNANVTYQEAFNKAQKSEEWF